MEKHQCFNKNKLRCSAGQEIDGGVEPGNKLPVSQMVTALAVSLAICKAGAYLIRSLGIQGGSLPAITAIVVTLSTIFPAQFNQIAPSGEEWALIVMQIC